MPMNTQYARLLHGLSFFFLLPPLPDCVEIQGQFTVALADVDDTTAVPRNRERAVEDVFRLEVDEFSVDAIACWFSLGFVPRDSL